MLAREEMRSQSDASTGNDHANGSRPPVTAIARRARSCGGAASLPDLHVLLDKSSVPVRLLHDAPRAVRHVTALADQRDFERYPDGRRIILDARVGCAERAARWLHEDDPREDRWHLTEAGPIAVYQGAVE